MVLQHGGFVVSSVKVLGRLSLTPPHFQDLLIPLTPLNEAGVVNPK